MTQFLTVLMFAAVVAVVVTTYLASLFARARFPISPEDRRIGCVDGLRGYLALAVMVHHFFIWLQVTGGGGVV